MTFLRLRAKSWVGDNPPPSVFLQGHVADALRAAKELLRATLNQQLRTLHLPQEQWGERLSRLVALASAVHDLGKANHQFQAMVHEGLTTPQALRHEWITLLILQQPGWREWLTPALGHPTDWQPLLWAVAGHHPAYERSWPEAIAASGDARLLVFEGHADFAVCLDLLRGTFDLAAPPSCKDVELNLNASLINHLKALRMAGHGAWSDYPPDARRFVAAAKAMLIAADVAGSALPRARLSPGQSARWIGEALAQVPRPEQLHQVVTDRLTDKETGRVHPPRPFQHAVAASSARVTLVTAGCGSGKTLAAYQWAARKAPGQRLYLCYPTTGTATEGFRDYLFDAEAHAGKFGADLFHGRADVDLEMILNAADDDPPTGLESLDAWSTPIVSCTVDTVLSLMHNGRKGLLAWPVFAGSAFVFDEIHAYDNRLFGILIRFLETFRHSPVLLMTASLPDVRRAELDRVLGKLGDTLHVVPGPADLEALPRYHRDTPAETFPQAAVERAIEQGGKVLWVCNTVDRAMQAAARVAHLSPLLYHSRYRYIDRVQRHKAVIEAFQKDGPALAICTQVAEMSLDLSATLLVTDLAPVPALIQRLGRLNRRARPPLPGQPPPPAMPFVVVEPTGPNADMAALPYEAQALAQARKWLAALGPISLSQADLAQVWSDFQDTAGVPRVNAGWVDGGPDTKVDVIRESAPGITVLLAADAAEARSDRVELTKRLLPMPNPGRRPWNTWEKVRGVPVAPDAFITYDPQRGGQWKR